MEFF
jgi:serine/threonine-protein phosphatase 4 regulatory subunit 1